MIRTITGLGLTGLAFAQAPGGTPCPRGYHGFEPNCDGDPCNVEGSIRAPANGNMGTCGRREFEFVHLRPDPIDQSDIALSSMQGAMGTIGIPFDSWSSTNGIRADNGAIFWSNPERGPTNPRGGAHETGIQVMQITVRNGEYFDATLNFQGRTNDGNCNAADDHDSHDACLSHDWEERQVHFSNRPGVMKSTSGGYHFLTPSVAVVAGPSHSQTGIAGYTTYMCIVQLKSNNDARNVYAIFGDAADPMLLPPAYQVNQAGFGADIGGTHHSLWTLMPESQFDSYLTLGTIDMDHPDILDNLHMLAHNEHCQLACDAGYTPSGIQPNCVAGRLTNTFRCVGPADGSTPPPAPVPTGKPRDNDALVDATLSQGPDSDDEARSDESEDSAKWMRLLRLGAVVVGGALVVGAAVVGYKIQSQAGRARVMDGKVANADVFQHAGRCSAVPEQGEATSAEDNAMFAGFTIDQ